MDEKQIFKLLEDAFHVLRIRDNRVFTTIATNSSTKLDDIENHYNLFVNTNNNGIFAVGKKTDKIILLDSGGTFWNTLHEDEKEKFLISIQIQTERDKKEHGLLLKKQL